MTNLDITYDDDNLEKRIEESCDFVKQWLPKITEEDKIMLMNIFKGDTVTIINPLLKKYIELITPYIEILGLSKNNKPREADCAASGIVFFYGCIIYIMHWPNWGQYIEDIFLYNLLYILVDHYIDDINIEADFKEKVIKQMYILVNDPIQYKTLPLLDPVLKTIAMVYHRLITRRPKTKKTIIKLFQAEIDGMSIQNNSHCSREQYYNIALKKGGYTMMILYYIVEEKEDDKLIQASYNLGEIMQLIDDSIDVLADRENHIHTIATYDLKTRGNLDHIWCDIVDKIKNIDDKFTIYKLIYNIFIAYLPDRMIDNYTNSIYRNISSVNLFAYCNGSKLLVDSIMNELSSMNKM